MKIVGMAQTFNEHKAGNLRRCLDHYSRLCDEMVVLDDASTDGSVEIIREYTDHVIVNEENNWEKNFETKNKAILLDEVMRHNPDWIVSFDADEIFDKRVFQKEFFRNMLNWADAKNLNSLCFNWLHLWLSPCWYRIDKGLGQISPPRVWRNTGEMKIEITSGLHKRLWPPQMDNPARVNLNLLHYSSSSEDKLYAKIANYIRLHPEGNYLAVMDNAELAEVDYEWFEDQNRPKREQHPDLEAAKKRILERLKIEQNAESEIISV